MLDVSVIICTKNPREDYFRRVLDALRAQTLPKSQWELLLIGVPVDGQFDFSWHPNVREVREVKKGLAQARMSGIAEARSDLLVFVDDDNVLRADYLENALKIAVEYPYLGAWGGSCIPEFEVEPPVEIRDCLIGLLVEKRTTAVWSKIPRGNWALPPGAGMVIRKKLGIFYRNQVLDDPLRNSLGPGNQPPRGADDSDLALCSFQLDLGTGMFPELELTHLIPARKLNLESLVSLHESFAYGGKLMEAIHDPDHIAKNLFYSPMLFPPSRLKTFLLGFYMLLTRKSRAERRIKLAEERGRIRAMRDLKSWHRPKSLSGT